MGGVVLTRATVVGILSQIDRREAGAYQMGIRAGRRQGWLEGVAWTLIAVAGLAVAVLQWRLL